jgi:hypothetical protein
MPPNTLKGPAGVEAPTDPEKIEQDSLPLDLKDSPKASRFQAKDDESVSPPFIPVGVPALRLVEELASKLGLHCGGDSSKNEEHDS